MNKEISGVYSRFDNLTFIVEETFDDNGNLISQEVKGFYHGKPNNDDNKKFYGKLKIDMKEGMN